MKRSLLCFIFILSLLLGGCGASAPSGAPAPSSKTALTFTDDLGREITVDTPKRVACLIGSFAHVWCLAGGQESLVAAAADTWTQFDLGLDEDVVNLGAVKEPNLELLLAAQPDLVIASSNTAAQVELLETFDAMGLNAAYFKVSSFEEYLEMLEICTRITGFEENYRHYGTDILAQVDAAREKADGFAPRVLYVRATGSSCKVKSSRDSVLGEMLNDLGCVNIADGGLLEELSMEVILQEDPEHIFLVIQGSDPTQAEALLEKTLLSNPAWEMLTAVQEGRLHIMDPALYNLKPNDRWGEAYEKLADILYP